MRISGITWQVLAVAALTASVSVAQQITVYSNDNVPIGQTRQMTAYVPLTPNTVSWTVNGVVGGDTANGTVSTAGLYTAPAVIPMNNVVHVRATSTAFTSIFGEA